MTLADLCAFAAVYRALRDAPPLPDAWERLARLQGRIWTRNAPPVTQRCPEWRVAA
jgi:glutathione S-transferase